MMNEPALAGDRMVSMKRRILLLTAMASAAFAIWVVTPEWLRSGHHLKNI